MKSVFVSFFNSANLGDCLLADSLYQLVSSEFETIRYSYAGNPNIITNLNNIRLTNHVDEISTKGKVYEIFKKCNFTLPILLYKKLKRPSNSYSDFKNTLQVADVLVIGGGNMIFDKDKFSDSASRFNDFVSIAKNQNKKVFAISLGIGPFQTTTQEEKAVEALSKCDFISFRDKKSYDIYNKRIKNMENVYLTVDPVFSLPLKLKVNEFNEVTIGLNVFNSKLISDSELEYTDLVRAYTELAKNLSQRLGVKIILFSTDLKDYEAVYEVYSALQNYQNIEIRDINGFDSLIDLYSEMSLLIGTRMHSMIIAYTQQIPLVGISWQPKVEAFFDIIKSKEDVYQYNTLESNIDLITKTCDKKLSNLESEKIIMKKNLEIIEGVREIDKNILITLRKSQSIKSKKG